MTCRFFCWFRWDSAVSFGVSEMGGGRRVWTVVLMVMGVSVCSRVCSGFDWLVFVGLGVVSGVSYVAAGRANSLAETILSSQCS